MSAELLARTASLLAVLTMTSLLTTTFAIAATHIGMTARPEGACGLTGCHAAPSPTQAKAAYKIKAASHLALAKKL